MTVGQGAPAAAGPVSNGTWTHNVTQHADGSWTVIPIFIPPETTTPQPTVTILVTSGNCTNATINDTECTYQVPVPPEEPVTHYRVERKPHIRNAIGYYLAAIVIVMAAV